MYTDEAADVLAIIPRGCFNLTPLMGAKGTQVKSCWPTRRYLQWFDSHQFITIQEEQTIEEVLRFLREHPPESACTCCGITRPASWAWFPCTALVTKLSAKVKDVMYRSHFCSEDMDQESGAPFDKYSF